VNSISRLTEKFAELCIFEYVELQQRMSRVRLCRSTPAKTEAGPLLVYSKP
jgi:hypothetical protein